MSKQDYIAKQREKRDKLKSAGICTQCGKEKAVNKTMCLSCREKHKIYQKSRNDRCVEDSLCQICGHRKVFTKTLCQICNDKSKIHRQQTKDIVYAAYGGYVCNCCGETEPVFLTIDHIKNDGGKLRKNKVHPTHGHSLYLWLIESNFPKDFQILCWNCQHGKRLKGECPHQKTNRLAQACDCCITSFLPTVTPRTES